MATIALASAATSSGLAAGSFGAMLFTTMGSIIDNAYLMPHLFPGEPLMSGQAGDMPIGTSSQGSPAQFAVGTKVRVPMSIIWQDERDTRTSNGSVGKGQRVITHKHFIGLMAEIGQMEIADVEEVRADAQIVYDSLGTTVNDTETTFSMTALTNSVGWLAIPLTDADLRDYRTGANAQVTLSGFASSGNNGTFDVSHVFISSNGLNTVMEIRITSFGQVLVNEGAGASVTITQTSQGWITGQFSGNTPTIHLGTDTQNPDPILEAVLGSGNVPGYRGIASIVWDSFPLRQFGGNRVPSFDAIINLVAAAQTVPGAISSIMSNAEIASSRFDTTGLSGTCAGYVISGRQEVGRALMPLMLFYDVAVRNDAGKLTFFDRESADTHDGSGLDEYDMNIDPVPSNSLPGEVLLQHIDPNNNYRANTVFAHVSQHHGKDKLSMNIPMSVNADDAREVAKRTLYRMLGNKLKVKHLLPPSFIRVQEGDIIENVPFEGQTYDIEISRATRGHTFWWQIEGTAIVTNGLDFTENAS